MVPEFKAHESQRLPETLWLGRKDGEWPIVVFEDETAAQRWQAEDKSTPVGGDRRVRRIWEISTADAVERIVQAVPESYSWRA